MITIEFLSLVLAIIANLTLAVLVLRFAAKANSRTFFVLFCLFQSIWIFVNYMSFQFEAGSRAWLDMGRLTMATAVFHPLFFFLFVYSFLRREAKLKYKYIIWLFLAAVLMMWLSLSPWLFTGTELISGKYTPVPGPGMFIFAVYVLVLVGAGFIRIFRKWRQTKGIEKIQWRLVGVGLISTFLMVLCLSFLSLILFKEIESVKFSHLYTLPFVIFTTYAIIKHRLLDLKVIVAELSVMLLNIIMLVRLLTSIDAVDFILNLILLGSGIVISVILVKSILKEIKTKEELQMANKKLKQLDKAKTEFISITSHELRTPLTGLQGYLSMMQQGDFGVLDDEKKNVIDQLARSTSRLIRLVNTFLNVSRIELGRLILNKSKVQIENVIETSIKDLEPEANKKGLKLKFIKSATPLPLLNIDQDKIKDVILNLIVNAIKYTKEGVIMVSTKVKDGSVETHVKDTGMGFSGSEKESFFKKFSRGRTSKLGIGGSGLGLFISKEIIKAHNGDMWCNSPGVNKGSTFSFQLPVK